MKDHKAIPKSTAGIVIGLILWFLWALLIIAIDMEFNITLNMGSYVYTKVAPILVWVLAGPLIILISIGHYIVSKDIIDEKMKTDEVISIKSGLIGFLLCLILMIFTYLLNIQFYTYTSPIGGFITIFLIYLYMEYKVAKEQKLTDITLTKIVLIFILLNTIYIAFTSFKT